MLETIVMIFPLVFTNNLVMSVVKYIRGAGESKKWLRGILGLLSLIGIVATSAYTGNPVDFNQFTDVGLTLVLAVVTAVMSHFSYRVIKES